MDPQIRATWASSPFPFGLQGLQHHRNLNAGLYLLPGLFIVHPFSRDPCPPLVLALQVVPL